LYNVVVADTDNEPQRYALIHWLPDTEFDVVAYEMLTIKENCVPYGTVLAGI
jgi:hypothetical protein